MTITTKSRLDMIREVATPGQIFCFIITILLCGYFPTIFHNCQSYTRFRELERPDYTHQSIQDFFMIIPYCFVIRIIKYTIHSALESYFRNRLTKYEGDELERKIAKCTRGAFKVLHFSFTFLFGWLMVLRKTSFCPLIMLGDGELMTVFFSDWPYVPMPEYAKFYYMFSLSYYLEDLVMHIFATPNSDYFEMILHHVVAAMLIFSSYFNGFWNIGIFVLMQMDISDIFVGLVRILIDFAAHWVLGTVYFFIMTSWFYFRFIAFTYCVLWKFGLGGRLSVDNHTSIVTLIDILLISLLGLNIYWFILLSKMGYRLAFKKKAHDLQNIVSRKDVE